MLYSSYRINLDVNDTNSQSTLSARQGDTNREIVISFSQDGVPYQIGKECYAVFSGLKYDGAELFNGCTIQNNLITYTFTEQTCNVPGKVDCEIILYGESDRVIASPRFSLYIFERATTVQSPESEDQFGALDELISRANEAINKIDNIPQNISGTYTLFKEDYDDSLLHSYTFQELGEYDLIEFYGATKEDQEYLSSVGVYVSANGNVVSFHFDSKPECNISLNYFITRGANPNG